MSVKTLESEVAKLGDAELAEFGLWFDSFREVRRLSDGDFSPEVEEAHREEVISRKQEYLADPSRAKVVNAAYFAELRKRLADARR
jgi:hypothetical protein